MKKIFTLVAAACVSAAAFAQAHCEWTVALLPQTVFATADDAVAAGYNTMWASEKYLGMPSKTLIDNEQITVSLPLAYNYVSVGNGKYSGKEYAYKLIMGMNNSTRDGIDPAYFAEGVENNDYIRKAGDSDQGNVVNDAVIKIDVKSANYGTVTLTYNRGGNNSSMYVVDATKSKMVLQSVTRCPDDNVQSHVARFGVEPNHTYYVMASEKGSVEFYGIAYDECADDTYTTLATEQNCTDLWTAAQLPQAKFATVEEAVAAGYNTMWTSADFLGMPSKTLIESERINVSLPLAYSYVSKGNGKYSGTEFAYKLIMGMNNSTRDGIDPAYFAEGVVNNDYIRKSGDSDQGNVVNDAVVKITVPASTTFGRVILNYNRGGNNAAMYVVDATKSKMVLQTVNRCPDDAVKTHSAIFNVEPGHEYYVMASEKGSVELYGIGYCSADSEKYALSGSASGINIVNNNAVAPANNRIYTLDGRFVGTDAAVLANGIYVQNGKKFVK